MTKTALSRCLGVNYVFEGHYNSYRNYFIGKKSILAKSYRFQLNGPSVLASVDVLLLLLLLLVVVVVVVVV